MRRETQNVLLVLLGGALLKIAWTGSYLRYVKPSLLPLLVASGVVILVLGVLAIIRDLRGAGGQNASHDDHAGRSPWLLLLPVLAIFLVAPPALGADTVARSAATVAAPQRDIEFPPLPDGAAPTLRMSDFVTRVIWDQSGALHGRQVQLLGFIVHSPEGRTYLARLAIACCAADATPMKVRLDGRDGLAQLQQDSWFEVHGQVVPGSATHDTGFVPTFTVTGLRPVPAPAEPYEF